jgi:hypothetical protein
MTKNHKTTQTETPGKPEDVPTVMALLFGWNMELSRFYLHRFQQYCALPTSFLSCHSLEDLRAGQAEFLKQLMDEYRIGSQRLSMIANADDATLNLDTNYAAKLLKAQEDAAAIIDQAKVQAKRILDSAERQNKPSQAESEQTALKKHA